MKSILFLAAILTVAAGALWSGIYNISALDPHWDVTRQLIEIARDRSIIAHSAGIGLPRVDDPKLSEIGASEFHEMCRICHGAPGQPAEDIAMGLYPAPADLLSGGIQNEWKDPQLFWIIDNGLKMTGMPAFGLTHDKKTILGIVAFLRRLPGMRPEQYRAITGAASEVNGSGRH